MPDSLATNTPMVHHRTPHVGYMYHVWHNPALPYPPEYVSWAQPELSTAIVDSIGADTIAPHFLTAEQAVALREKAEADSIAAAVAYAEAHTGHAAGIAPEPLPQSYSGIDALTAPVALLIALMALCSHNIRSAVKNYLGALWSIRKRANAFDDTQSVPIGIAVLLGVVFIVFGGITLFAASPLAPQPSVQGVTCAIGLTGVYYLFQLAAYNTTAFAFGTGHDRTLWLGGFVASQAFCGLLLVVPVLLLMYVPACRSAMFWLCVAIYAGARIVFIGKGIRIFYRGFDSLLYFILYLCSLEIIPLLAIYSLLPLLVQM